MTAVVHELKTEQDYLNFLTKYQFRIISLLNQHKPNVVTRTQFAEKELGGSWSNSLDAHICYLRERLRKFDIEIVTHRGVGYSLQKGGWNLDTKKGDVA